MYLLFIFLISSCFAGDEHGDDHNCAAESEVLQREVQYPDGCKTDPSYTTHVSLVVEAGSVIEDGTFISLAIQGARRGCNEAGKCCLEVDTPTSHEDGYECEMEYAAADSNLTIGVGFAHQEAVHHVAKYLPNRNFACIDVAFGEQLPNLEGVTFREDQAGYLVGVIAGQVTQSKKLGVICGPDVVPVKSFANGFKNGVLRECSDCEVTTVYATWADGGFNNGQNWGVEQAKIMLAAGIDVIFGVGGYTGSVAIRYAALPPGETLSATIDNNGNVQNTVKPSDEPQVYVIGVDSDEWTTTFDSGNVAGSEKIITSALKKVDWGTEYAILRYLRGHVVGGNDVLGTEEGGVDFAGCHEACGYPVTQALMNRADNAKASMVLGSLSTGIDLTTGEMATTTSTTSAVADEGDEKMPGWATALIIVALIIAILALCCVGYIYYVEKIGGKAFFTMQNMGGEAVQMHDQEDTEKGPP